MKGIFVMTCFAVALVGCSEEREVRNAVSEQLKDPQSARFQNEREVRKGLYCGEVNAKNSFGGYTGFQPFIVVDREERGLDAMVGDIDSWVVEGACQPGKLPKGVIAFMPIKPDGPVPSTSTPYWVARVSVAGRSEWLLSNLEKFHYPVFTEKSGDGVLRIFVGPWKKRESAEAQLAMLRVEMGVDGFVMMYKN